MANKGRRGAKTPSRRRITKRSDDSDDDDVTLQVSPPQRRRSRRCIHKPTPKLAFSDDDDVELFEE